MPPPSAHEESDSIELSEDVHDHDQPSEEDDDHYSHSSATHLLGTRRNGRPPFLLRGYGTHNDIDFTSAALYVPGIQVVLALTVCCATMLVVCTVLPQSSMSAVRTATLSGIVGMTLVARPVRVLDCYGMDLVFDTIRPAVVAYLIAIIGEQLVHGCGMQTEDVKGTPLKRMLYHACIGVALLAGFARAYQPTSQHDHPFLVSTLALVTIALVPPNPHADHGPLCGVGGAWDAAERLARAALFGTSFCTLAYASEPARHSVSEICLASARATAGSAWILGVHSIGLSLAPIQVALIVVRRLRHRHEWEEVATGKRRTDEQRNGSLVENDMEAGMFTSGVSGRVTSHTHRVSGHGHGHDDDSDVGSGGHASGEFCSNGRALTNCMHTDEADSRHVRGPLAINFLGSYQSDADRRSEESEGEEATEPGDEGDRSASSQTATVGAVEEGEGEGEGEEEDEGEEEEDDQQPPLRSGGQFAAPLAQSRGATASTWCRDPARVTLQNRHIVDTSKDGLLLSADEGPPDTRRVPYQTVHLQTSVRPSNCKEQRSMVAGVRSGIRLPEEQTLTLVLTPHQTRGSQPTRATMQRVADESDVAGSV